MSSRSPRTRIDQFFTSKKKRPISPCLKAEKSDKGANSLLDGSPSAKGTLDSLLISSHRDNCLAKPTHEDRGAVSKNDTVKRNLTSEINLASEIITRPSLSVDNLESREHSEQAGVASNVQQVASFKIPKESIAPHGAYDIATQAHGKETVSSTFGEQNLELKQFAADFLSLYCSELPSSVTFPLELKFHGNKRTGSPSLLVNNCKMCKKKQCVSHCNESQLEEQKACLEMEYSKKVNSGLESVPAGASTRNFGTIEGEDEAVKEPDGINAEAYSSFRKCSQVPNPCLIVGESCTTPGPSANASCTHETPKSLQRSSGISPGDAFWNEAIQVADGLFGADDKVSVCITKGISHIEGQSKMDAEKSSRSVEDGTVFGHLKLNATVGSIESSVKESTRLPAVDFCKDASPLPVRHFDFSFEEKNLGWSDQNLHALIDSKNVDVVRNGFPECSSVNQGVTRTSNIVTCCKSLTNEPHNSEVKLEQSFHVPSEVGESTSDLAIHNDKSSKLSQENRSKIADIHKDLALVTTSNMLENEIKSSIGVGCGFDEADTPLSSRQLKDGLQLSNWLPSQICNIYMRRGISKLYSWQVACLQVDGVLQKRNLVYCASTSAGKSFVAEILMLQQVISTGKMALLVLPYVSICAEKAEHLEGLLEPLGKHVRSFYGNQGGGTLPKDTSVAVCTIEKANSLVNRLLEEGRLSEVGIIVIDELHMVGDQNRGYLLELLLTKLRYAAGEGNAESSGGESSSSGSGKSDPAQGLQIVGMSATMPNVAAVADWLQAALYQTDFRPVPLEEYFKVGNAIFDKKMDIVRTIPKSADLGGKDPDQIVELCNEVVKDGHSVLLFCSSRKGCESTAMHVAKFLKEFSPSRRDSTCEFSDASSAIDALRRCPAGLDPILEETLPSGVAYHHAGLTVEEREIVETCYRSGLVRVLTATSTLAAGVNLPARRVIFRQPRIGCDFIDGTRYRQMAGRAGRAGIDTRGESILICKPEEVKRIAAMLNDNCPPLQSCLSEDKNGMTHAILEVVAGGIVQTASDIHRYVRCTLLNSTRPFQDVVKSAQDSLRWLCHRKFLEWSEETKLYSTTPLGRAAFGSSLCPEESLVVLDDLSRAREAFVLASDLHLVYLVTPINVDVEPDWELYYQRFMELSALDQSVGNRVGVVEPFLMRMAHGAPVHIQSKSRGKKGICERPQSRNTTTDKCVLSDEQTLRVCRRFYVALMLSRLVQEVPVADVCEAFKVSRGMVQALQENAGRFALMVSIFCERLGWHDLEGLVSKFQNRVSFGVRAEIAELTTIPYVKGSRARALYKAGLRTPLAIAEASIPDIVKALFEYSSAWAVQEGSAMRHIQFGLAKKIKNGARKIVLDKAEEARIAAFSAFKSLGVLAPQLSHPLLSPGIDNSLVREGRMDSGKDNTSDSGGTEPEIGIQPASSLCFDGMKKLDNISRHYDEKSTVESQFHISNAEDVKSIDSIRYDCNDSIKILLASLAPAQCPETDSIANGTENSSSQNLGKAGNSNIMPGEHLNHKEPEGNHGGNKSNYSSRISEKGPINASNMPGGFESFLDCWDVVKEFCFDVHFTKRNERNSLILFEIHGIAVCWENSPVYYVNLPKDLVSSNDLNSNKKDSNFCAIEADDVNDVVALNNLWNVAKYRWNKIAMIMERIDVKKVTWNLKIQIQVLQNPMISVHRFGGHGFEPQKMNDIKLIENSYLLLPSVSVKHGVDMCIVAWILWPDEESSSSPNLEKEVKKRLSAEAAAAANRDGRWRNQMRTVAHNGCCRHAAQIRALSSALWKLVISDSDDLVGALTKIENPLAKVLADMEIWGIGVDLEACLKARHVLAKKLKELELEAYSLAGMTFSLYTSADIADVLYRHLKLPLPEGQNKGKQHPSTDKHSLDLLRHQHPIVSIIKEHRTLAKLLNSTLGSICSQARLRSEKYTIHGHWLQTSTATGRLSMEEPNLQCVEHMVDFTIHHQNNSSSSDTNHHQINARDFFLPTQDNWLLLTADYSQIELRLMAHFSKDSSLIELLCKPDGDVFTMMAAKWTGQNETAVSSQEREQTKRLVYGILYGMGANTLAEQLECSSDEAAEKIKSFKSSFPGVSVWVNAAVASCRQKGYIETLKGRKRFLTKIKFGSNQERAKAQRQAVNSICQGSAADIIKIAMINIHSVIVEGHGAEDFDTAWATEFSVLKGRCRILLQVHDELLLEVDPSLVKEAGLLLKLSMERAVSLKVPLRVKLKVGRKWGSLDPLEVERE